MAAHSNITRETPRTGEPGGRRLCGVAEPDTTEVTVRTQYCVHVRPASPSLPLLMLHVSILLWGSSKSLEAVVSVLCRGSPEYHSAESLP